MPLAAGTRLGSYEVVSPLGAGAMGEVYRARHLKLGRDVAIKVLPSEFAKDPRRRQRFEREARAASALNHPNIVTIHDIDEHDGTHYIAMELVEGRTLRTLLGAAPLPLARLLAIARQIAEGLAKAHAAGIVHRDLKPANLMVTDEGLVKILDFGLAKLAPQSEQAGSELTTVELATRPGVVLGTVPYMSPEQAAGRSVDFRSDQFSFGSMLYEMATGRQAFRRDTSPQTLAAIIDAEPEPLGRMRPRVPAPLITIIGQCLAKRPESRFPSTRDLAAALQTVPETRAAIRIGPWGSSAANHLLGARRLTMAGLIVAIIGAVTLHVVDSPTPVPKLVNPVRMTSALGVEDHPTWSPDNRTVAYESAESGNWDIWLAQVGSGPAVNRTADHPGADRYPSWSPDGRRIAFWSDRDGGGYAVMPALGGMATKLIATPGPDQSYHSAPEWSADGTRLAGVVYSIAGSRFQHSVEIVSVDTRESLSFRLAGTEGARLDLSWSSDGQSMAYVDSGQQQAETGQLRVLRLRDGASVAVSDGRTNVRRPRWSRDGRYLFYVCNCVGPSDLWRQRIAPDGSTAGPPGRVTIGLDVRDAVFSPDGSRLAYAKGRWVSNFWRVPILPDRPATWSDAEQVTFDQAYVEFLDVSPDGRRVAYSSDRAGNQDLWVMPIGGEPVQLTTDPAPDWAPSWSPDGRQLAFYSYRTGDREIWTMPATGGAATQVTRTPGLDAGPQWSPDGRKIAFRSERTGDSEVWVVSGDGTESRQITRHPANDSLPAWSPDGRWLVFSSNRTGKMLIWRVASRGGEPELLTRGPGLSPRWYGDDIYFGGTDERQGNLWRLSMKDRRERPATHLVGRRGTLGLMTPATDGKFLYLPWRDDLGDIWVMDVVPR